MILLMVGTHNSVLTHPLQMACYRSVIQYYCMQIQVNDYFFSIHFETIAQRKKWPNNERLRRKDNDKTRRMNCMIKGKNAKLFHRKKVNKLEPYTCAHLIIFIIFNVFRYLEQKSRVSKKNICFFYSDSYHASENRDKETKLAKRRMNR